MEDTKKSKRQAFQYPAQGKALVRAKESSRPEERRICYDPIARSLVNTFSVFMSKLENDSGLYEEGEVGTASSFFMAVFCRR